LEQTDTRRPEPRRGFSRADRINLIIWLLVGFVSPLPLVLALGHVMKRSDALQHVQIELPTKAILAFFAVLATWIVSRRENRPMDDYGIPPRQAFGVRFWEGTVWGFAMLSAVLLVLHALGDFQIDSVALSGSAAVRFAIGWGAVFLGVGITEEFGFRGYWLFVTARRIGFWKTAVFLSLIFAAAHLGNSGENALGIAQVFGIGMLWCLTIRRTGNLWFAVGFHAAWDWAETFFYGTADSGMLGAGRLLNSTAHGANWLTGGSAGPEGSVVALGMIALFALLIHIRFPRASYADRPV
jgi:uncharacterized protein